MNNYPIILAHGIARFDFLLANFIRNLGPLGSFVDWGFEHKGSHVIELLKPLIDLDGFLALTTSACREFNDSAAESEAANPVVYQTYASQEPQNKVFTLLQPSWEIIAQAEGAN